MGSVDIAVLAGIWMVLNAIFLLWLYRGYCRHQWEKSEVREYPPALGDGSFNIRGDIDGIIELKSSHTTYVQRCSKCGLEKYHTERRP
jgi:hypothetical protein